MERKINREKYKQIYLEMTEERKKCNSTTCI